MIHQLLRDWLSCPALAEVPSPPPAFLPVPAAGPCYECGPKGSNTSRVCGDECCEAEKEVESDNENENENENKGDDNKSDNGNGKGNSKGKGNGKSRKML